MEDTDTNLRILPAALVVSDIFASQLQSCINQALHDRVAREMGKTPSHALQHRSSCHTEPSSSTHRRLSVHRDAHKSVGTKQNSEDTHAPSHDFMGAIYRQVLGVTPLQYFTI